MLFFRRFNLFQCQLASQRRRRERERGLYLLHCLFAYRTVSLYFMQLMGGTDTCVATRLCVILGIISYRYTTVFFRQPAFLFHRNDFNTSALWWNPTLRMDGSQMVARFTNPTKQKQEKWWPRKSSKLTKILQGIESDFCNRMLYDIT